MKQEKEIIQLKNKVVKEIKEGEIIKFKDGYYTLVEKKYKMYRVGDEDIPMERVFLKTIVSPKKIKLARELGIIK